MSNLRVLIVEDTRVRQEHLTRLFADHAYEVCETAGDASQRLSGTAYDIVCLDYDLADDRCGAEVADVLRSSPSASAVVIIQSMNPAGVAKILEVLPDAYPVSLAKLDRRTAAYAMLRAALAAGDLARFVGGIRAMVD